MNSPDSDPQLNYAICDQEKIHLIGEVQNHGVFIAVSIPDHRIQLVSENIHTLVGGTGEAAEGFIGKRLDELFSDGLAAEIQTKIKLGFVRTAAHPFEWKGENDYDVYLYSLSENQVGIEISPYHQPRTIRGSLSQSPEEHLRLFLQQMKSAKTIEAFSQIACRSVRLLTGLDRVMIYRFTPSWNGDVIAEDRSASVHSFLQHKFPASDIPQPARDLYLRNQVRFILDSAEGASPILPKVTKHGKNEVDLSDSRLRAVSKYHLEYLKNMGVTTSFSVAITVEGRLWGLIACHAQSKTYIPHSVRSLCQTLADTVALASGMLEERGARNEELEFHSNFHQLFGKLSSSNQPVSQLMRELDEVNALFASQGFALVSPKKTDFSGISPTLKDLKVLYEVLNPLARAEKGGVLAVDHLSKLDPQWESISFLASGILCVALPEYDDSLLMVFRSEHLKTIKWGGNPREKMESRNYSGMINPRASFESWSETIKNTSLSWKPFEIKGMASLKLFVFDALVRNQRMISELSESLLRKSSF